MIAALPSIQEKQIDAFQSRVLKFYKDHGRDLPWRKTTDPYSILISEIMLQQPQVDRVKDYYQDWLKRWPTVEKLAKADRATVLKYWVGLGYNNRAINLHKAAQKIVNDYDGNVILALQDHKNVPGIGPYTAAAVQIFAQNKDIAAVDTNIRRILIHEFGLPEKNSDRELWELAGKCLPKDKSRDWHNALMDYGATLLTARRTGIRSKTQQSKFEGSDRQVRAKIVKHLLKKKSVTEIQLKRVLGVEQERLSKILTKLVKEELIKKRKEGYSV